MADIHRGDPDRLFTAPIIEYLGPFSALSKEQRDELRQLDAYGRTRLVEELLEDGASTDKDEQLRSSWLLGALCELETWELMLRLQGSARTRRTSKEQR